MIDLKKKKILQGFYPKGSLFRKFLSQESICQYIKIWLFGVKANNDEPSEYRPIGLCMPSERELSCLLDLNPIFFS